MRKLSLSGNTHDTSGTLGCHTDVDGTLLWWFLNLPHPKNHLEHPTSDKPEPLGKGPGTCILFPEGPDHQCVRLLGSYGLCGCHATLQLKQKQP